MLETITSLYAPHACLMCQAEGNLLCSECVKRLPRVAERCYRCKKLSPNHVTCQACRRHSGLYAAHATTSYDGVAKEMIAMLKFSGARTAASTIAQTMASLDLPGEAMVVPVPTATRRIRLRGYDQASLIARSLARRHQLAYGPYLVRTGQHRQVGASRQLRLQQMEHSFFVRNGAEVAGKHILLVDDVITTGASLESAAAVLKASGAKRVEAVVFARA